MHIWTPALFQLFPLLFIPSITVALSEGPAPLPEKPCTIHSPNTGLYFDLSTIAVLPPEEKDGKKHFNVDRNESWHARGHDYGANFTINICAPVIEQLTDVVGVEKERWQNISAYYEMNGKTYSIGQQSSSLFFRGRKLVLNYTDGSPCPPPPSQSKLHSRTIVYDQDDEDKDKKQDDGKPPGNDTMEKEKEKEPERRKATLMTFLCDRDLVTPAATISFDGSLDSCSYFFEVRTAAACGGVAAGKDGGVGPAGVFGIIACIAIAAYLIGGCAYQRTVMQQRGWRQCPNYNIWSGTFSFFGGICGSLFSCCFRLTGRQSGSGYSQLSTGNNGGRRGLVGAIGGRGNGSNSGSQRQRHDVDEENRLIDQLDEEWDD
ncbi:Cation-independent mannose-6-phosphate receptor CI-MPR [Myotisia sp. PD_48]|nr:Cation-independent mannose-6-phosphate receptor CI-MPR [Myotisia sp. PD_48]